LSDLIIYPSTIKENNFIQKVDTTTDITYKVLNLTDFPFVSTFNMFYTGSFDIIKQEFNKELNYLVNVLDYKTETPNTSNPTQKTIFSIFDKSQECFEFSAKYDLNIKAKVDEANNIILYWDKEKLKEFFDTDNIGFEISLFVNSKRIYSKFIRSANYLTQRVDYKILTPNDRIDFCIGILVSETQSNFDKCIYTLSNSKSFCFTKKIETLSNTLEVVQTQIINNNLFINFEPDILPFNLDFRYQHGYLEIYWNGVPDDAFSSNIFISSTDSNSEKQVLKIKGLVNVNSYFLKNFDKTKSYNICVGFYFKETNTYKFYKNLSNCISFKDSISIQKIENIPREELINKLPETLRDTSNLLKEMITLFSGSLDSIEKNEFNTFSLKDIIDEFKLSSEIFRGYAYDLKFKELLNTLFSFKGTKADIIYTLKKFGKYDVKIFEYNQLETNQDYNKNKIINTGEANKVLNTFEPKILDNIGNLKNYDTSAFCNINSEISLNIDSKYFSGFNEEFYTYLVKLLNSRLSMVTLLEYIKVFIETQDSIRDFIDLISDNDYDYQDYSDNPNDPNDPIYQDLNKKRFNKQVLFFKQNTVYINPNTNTNNQECLLQNYSVNENRKTYFWFNQKEVIDLNLLSSKKQRIKKSSKDIETFFVNYKTDFKQEIDFFKNDEYNIVIKNFNPVSDPVSDSGSNTFFDTNFQKSFINNNKPIQIINANFNQEKANFFISFNTNKTPKDLFFDDFIDKKSFKQNKVLNDNNHFWSDYLTKKKTEIDLNKNDIYNLDLTLKNTYFIKNGLNDFAFYYVSNTNTQDTQNTQNTQSENRILINNTIDNSLKLRLSNNSRYDFSKNNFWFKSNDDYDVLQKTFEKNTYNIFSKKDDFLYEFLNPNSSLYSDLNTGSNEVLNDKTQITKIDNNNPTQLKNKNPCSQTLITLLNKNLENLEYLEFLDFKDNFLVKKNNLFKSNFIQTNFSKINFFNKVKNIDYFDTDTTITLDSKNITKIIKKIDFQNQNQTQNKKENDTFVVLLNNDDKYQIDNFNPLILSNKGLNDYVIYKINDDLLRL